MGRALSRLSADDLVFAASVKWHHSRQRLQCLLDRQLAIQFTPDPDDLPAMFSQLHACRNQRVPVCLHAFFPGYEIGDVRPDAAWRAMQIHYRMLEFSAEAVPGAVITCHVGLQPALPLAAGRLEENLGLLVQRAGQLGLTVAIENLRQGPAADPWQLWRWAETSGAALTLDVGHALSARLPLEQTMSMPDLIALFAPRLVEVHYYEREDDRHYRPETMAILGPVVNLLAAADCRWWTIELEKLADIDHTLAITREYLALTAVSAPAVPLLIRAEN